MFRLQDNLPEVYINESRDFLLLARLSDVLFSGIKYDIDSMVNVLDATLAKDRLLLLMCTKVGFFPTIDIDAQILKYIIASFPFIIKNKGNLKGIQYAVNAVLKAESNPDATGEPLIKIVNAYDDSNMGLQPYTIYIYTAVQLYNKNALKELLCYVLPSGYTYKLLSYEKLFNGKDRPDILSLTDYISGLKIKVNYGNLLRTSFDKPSLNVPGLTSSSRMKSFVDNLIGAFDAAELSTSLSETDDGLNIEVLTISGSEHTFESGSDLDILELKDRDE